MSKRGLGRGLDALLSVDNVKPGEIVEVNINDIEPNLNQPRKKFDEEKLEELAASIKSHGLVQPVVARKDGDRYTLIAGERRWRAAKLAGLKAINVLVRELSDQEIIEVALIENIQREDLNPIEQAEAYSLLIKDFRLNQEKIAEIVGKSRSAVANTLRLLGLAEIVRNGIFDGVITEGHGRALLGLDDMALMEKVFEEVVKKGYNVRDTERLVKGIREGKSVAKKEKVRSEEELILEERLMNKLGTKVKLNFRKNRGSIVIEYYSKEELDRIIGILGGNE